MLRIGTLIMFLVAIGVAYGTTLALDLLVDRSASDTAETHVDADAIFGSTEPAKLSANAKESKQISANEAEIRRIARQVAEATAARVATEIAREEVSSQL